MRMSFVRWAIWPLAGRVLGVVAIILCCSAGVRAQSGTPTTSAGWLAQGEQLLKSGQSEAAQTAFESAVQLDSMNARAYLGLAKASILTRGLDVALVNTVMALRRDSTLAEAYAFKAAIAGQFYSRMQGIADYSLAIRYDSTVADYFLQRGVLYFERQENALALSDLNRALALNDSLTDAYLYRGYAHMGLNQLEPARADLQRCIALDPTRADAYTDLGNLAAAENESNQALEWYNKAVAANPTYARAFFARAKLRSQLDGFAEAKADADTAIRLAPRFQQAYELRAQLYLSLREYEKTIADCDTSISLRPSPEAHVNRANALYNLKRLQDALPDAAAAVNLDPNYPQAYLMRGLIRLQLDLKATACRDFKRAYDLGLMQTAGLIKKHCPDAPAPVQGPVPAPTPTPAPKN